ncbi:hypothetical protein ACQVU0_32185, partial [Bacillus paranthracis]
EFIFSRHNKTAPPIVSYLSNKLGAVHTRLQALWVVLFVFRRFFCAFFQDVDRYLPTRFAKNTATSLAITFKISIAIVKSISMRSPPFSIK